MNFLTGWCCMNIKQITTLDECGYIEFKRQWYWDLSDKPDNDEIQNLWGEFIKDFLALLNSNVQSFGYDRYLIIGFDESHKSFFDFKLDKKLFDNLRQKIREKVKSFISNSSDIKYDITMENENGVNILLISIKQPKHIHSLTKNIKTKDSSYDEDSVLCRKNNASGKEDRVGIMPKEQIIELEKKLNPTQTKDNLKIRRKKSIKATIDSYLEINKTFSLSKDFPRISDDSEKYYEFYELNNTVNNNKMYFLYISDTKMEDTVKKVINECKNYFSDTISVLIDKPTKNKQPKKRKDNFESYFKKYGLKNFTLEFIDDFGKKYLYREYLEPFLFKNIFGNTDNFIDNNVIDNTNQNKTDLKASQVISEWFEEEDSPIIVLTGIGGVGKTTLTRYFLNTVLQNQEQESYLLFLESSELLDKLKSTTVSSIYDLYKADLDDSNQLTEKLFRLSIDNGSFIIVLDGLDEIISRMKENFQLDYFLHKIYEDYCFNSAKTKIIITCRDSIWDESLSQSEQIQELNIRNIQLQPFSEEQAKKFFESCFKNTPLQKKAFSLVEKLIGESNDKVYSPFMLDTIRSIISDDNEVKVEDLFSQEKSMMDKICLSTSSQTDYLIYAVCKRESKKLTIDFLNQIKLLCNMCKNNGLTELDFIKLVEEILDKKINNQDLSLLKAHPFILENNGKFNLRYDFLRDFFTIILMAQKITDENSLLDKDVLLLLDKKIGYLNKFSMEVAERTISFDRESISFNVISNIENIVSSNEGDYPKKFISSLFLIYLAILKKRNSLENKQDLQKSLFDIFSPNAKNDTLKNFCLCNINNPQGKPKLIFDFSSIILEDFYIKNYSEFYNCEFNDKTFFKSGELDLIEPTTSLSRLNFKKSNFSDKVIFLGNTQNILENIDIEQNNQESNKENNFKNFIRKFHVHGRFVSKKVNEIKAKQGQLVSKMLEIKVIVIDKDSKLNEDEYKINPEYLSDFTKYLDSSIKTPSILSILGEM